MPKKENHLGELEEKVMLAIVHLGEGAYGVPVRAALEEAGRSVSVGALYVTLQRLEEKGLVAGRDADPTPERGGRAKRYFRVTGGGHEALEATEAARQRLRGLALPGLLGGAA